MAAGVNWERGDQEGVETARRETKGGRGESKVRKRATRERGPRMAASQCPEWELGTWWCHGIEAGKVER